MFVTNVLSNISINGNVHDVFTYVVPIDVNLIFKRKGIIPGVKSSSNTETWNQAGLTRTVVFEDNNTAQEKLESVLAPESFSYTISNFTSVLRVFVSQISGNWIFQTNDNKTHIHWTYSLHAHGIIGHIITQAVIKKSMQMVMDEALRIIKKEYEKT